MANDKKIPVYDYIPKTFSLGGKKYLVKLADSIHSGSAQGILHHNMQSITIAKKIPIDSAIVDMSTPELEHTFYHELVHSILISMGESDLNKDEKFVDLFALFLHQFIVTKK